jgi:serine/threonine protein kinase
MIGSELNHYRITELLGSGGMGEVYAAEDTKLKRRVAIKLLPTAVAAEPERRQRFEREAHAIAALNHPNIVTVHSIEQSGEHLFLTMELVADRAAAHVRDSSR